MTESIKVRNRLLAALALSVLTLSAGCQTSPGEGGSSSSGDTSGGAIIGPGGTGASITDPVDFTAMNAAAEGAKPAPSCEPIGSGARFDIGSTATPTLDDVPWTSLGPGDVVCVPYRAEPYRAKIYFVTRGASGAPIRLVGLRGPNGERPVIDGDGATTSKQIQPETENEFLTPFGVISFLTHFVSPAGATWGWHPGWITVSGLKVQHVRPHYSFTDAAGKKQSYAGFSAAFYINPGDNIVIEDCEITDSQIGVFSKSFELESGQEDRSTVNLTLRGNYIHDNGDTTMLGIHNVYIEGRGCNLIGNYFGFNATAMGSNVKTRCGHERIYANTFVGGTQSMLEQIGPESGWDSIGVAKDFEPTVVAGNVFIFPAGGASMSFLHFGGDSYDYLDHYRTNLILYANTFVTQSHGGDRIPLMDVSHVTPTAPGLTGWLSSNVISNLGDGQPNPIMLSLAAGQGSLIETNSWRDPTVPDHDPYQQEIGPVSVQRAIGGATPDFIDGKNRDFHPAKSSKLLDGAEDFTALPAESLASTVTDFALYEFTGRPDNSWYRARPVVGRPDVGAYEAAP